MPTLQHLATLLLFLSLPIAVTLAAPAAAGGEARSAPRRPPAAALGAAAADAPSAKPSAEPAPPSYAAAMGDHETRYRQRGRYGGRAHNVELAAMRLSGAILRPGEALSFNARVGERSRDRGFRVAPVIRNGEIEDGMGGGVCQVSSTLHVAALHAGLEIVEHRTHSRPSTYVGEGLDATVSWGSIDYVVRNPYPYPVRIDAVAKDGALEVRVRGADAARFELAVERLRDLPFEESIVEDPGLPVGERRIEREGRDGAVVRVVRTSADGRRDAYTRRYAASDAVVRVGTGPTPQSPAAIADGAPSV